MPIFTSDLPNDADMNRALGSIAIPCDLPWGDCCFWGVGDNGVTLKIAIERKKAGDLVACILSGRYLHQAQISKEGGIDVLVLIAEVGEIRSNPDDGLLEMKVWGINPRTLHRAEIWQPVRPAIMYSRWCQYLFELTRLAGIYVFQTHDVAETACVIRSLYSWFQKPPDQHGSLNMIFKAPAPTVQLVQPSLVRRVAVELSGIGWERSRDVAEHFRSVAAMVRADEKEWRKVAGIGKKLARSVVADLHGR